MSDPNAPARYSDEANLEPVARAAEVTPEIETELPEGGTCVEVDAEPRLVAGTFLGLDDEGRAIVSTTKVDAPSFAEPTLEQIVRDVKRLVELAKQPSPTAIVVLDDDGEPSKYYVLAPVPGARPLPPIVAIHASGRPVPLDRFGCDWERLRRRGSGE